MKPLQSQEFLEPESFRCLEDNIGFVMLSEILRAYSHQLVDLLKKEEPDLTASRRLALTMQLASDHLSKDATLVCQMNQPRKNATNSTASGALTHEPASVQSIIDLSYVAAQKRLSEVNLSLQSPTTACNELFVSGNPWELSYVLFFIMTQSAQTRGKARKPESQSAQVFLMIETEADFVDLIVGSDEPISPFFESGATVSSQTRLSREEWFCLQRLANRNNAHIHVQSSNQDHQHIGAYSLVLRLPTFQPGHEEPLDFLTLNAFQAMTGQKP